MLGVAGTPSVSMQMLIKYYIRLMLYHNCKKRSMTVSSKENSNRNRDNLVYTLKGHFKITGRLTRKGEMPQRYSARKLNLIPWECPAILNLQLPWQHVGIYKFNSVSDEVCHVSHTEILGKLVLVGDVISEHPKEWFYYTI